MKKKWFTYFKVILGIAVLAYLVLKVDFSSLLTSLANAGFSYIAMGFVCFLVHRAVIDSFRFYYLVKAYFKSYFKILKVFFIGVFLNNVLIGGVSAEVYKLYYINTRIKNIGKATSYLFIEKVTLLLVSVATLIAYLILNHNKIIRFISSHPIDFTNNIGNKVYQFIGLGVLLLFIVSILVFRKFFVEWANRIKSYFIQFMHSLRTLQRSIYSVSLVTAVLSYLFKTASFFFLVKAFGQDVSFIKLFVMVCSMRFLAYIPIGMGNIGIMEGYIVVALGLFGVDMANGLAIAIVVRVINYILAIVGAACFFLNKASYDSIKVIPKGFLNNRKNKIYG